MSNEDVGSFLSFLFKNTTHTHAPSTENSTFFSTYVDVTLIERFRGRYVALPLVVATGRQTHGTARHGTAPL